MQTALLQLPAVTTQAFLGQQDATSQATSRGAGGPDASSSVGALGGSGVSAASSSFGVQSVLTQLASLQDEVESLRRAVQAPEAVFVQSIRSKMVHKGRVSESTNPPTKWRTVCGWPYGVRNFLRVLPTEIDEANKCQRCFDPQEGSSSSSSSDSSASGGSSFSADAETSSEVNEYG